MNPAAMGCSNGELCAIILAIIIVLVLIGVCTMSSAGSGFRSGFRAKGRREGYASPGYNTTVETVPSKQNFEQTLNTVNAVYNLASGAISAGTFQATAGMTDIQNLTGDQAIVGDEGISTSIFGVVGRAVNDPTTAIVAFRGTVSYSDWITDLSYSLTAMSSVIAGTPAGVSVSGGFLSLYGTPMANKTAKGCLCSGPCSTTGGLSGNWCYTQDSCGTKGLTGYWDSCTPGTTSAMNGQLAAWIAARPNVARFIVTGHSLGAALATIAAMQLVVLGKKVSAAYYFSSPKVGNPAMATFHDAHLLAQAFRFLNVNDLVPTVPTAYLPTSNCFQHVGQSYALNIWPAGASPCGTNALDACHVLSGTYLPYFAAWETAFGMK